MSRQDAIKGIHDLVQEGNKISPDMGALKTRELESYFHGLGSGPVDVGFLATCGVTKDEFISGIPDLKKIHEMLTEYATNPDQHEKDLGYSQHYKTLFEAMIKARSVPVSQDNPT